MSRARVSQHGAEVWYDWIAADPTTITGVGVSQHGAEVWYAASEHARVSQYGAEVWYLPSADDTESAPAPPAGGGGVRVFGYAG